MSANLRHVTRTASSRKTAAERREEIVAVALRHFSEGGLSGTSTEAIAREVGLSQPYLFRLFGTKRNLFLACYEVVGQRISEAFTRAAEGLPVAERLPAMGRAYYELLQDRTLLRMQLQTHAAAAADPELQEQARQDWLRVVDVVRRLAHVEGEELVRFMATGMLLNVMAALEVDGIESAESFMQRWCDPERLIAPATDS